MEKLSIHFVKSLIPICPVLPVLPVFPVFPIVFGRYISKISIYINRIGWFQAVAF